MICTIFTIFLGVSAFGAELPEKIEEKGDKYFVKSHMFDKDNMYILYFDGQDFYASLSFEDSSSYQLSIRNMDTGSWVHTEGFIYEDKPLVKVDFSSFVNGHYKVRVFYNSTGNVYDDGYQYADYAVVKTADDDCYFEVDAGTDGFSFVESIYNCITEDDHWYYTDYLAPDEGTETYELFKPVVDDVTEGLTSDYDKARAIYTWVADNIYYDYPAFYSGDLADAADTILVMKNKRGVCAGYAKVTSVMMTMAGIPCMYQTGMCGTIGHAWNAVCIDGKWCYIDTTWGSNNKYGFNNDDVFDKGNVSYQYFATTKRFIAGSRTIDPIFSDMVINGIKYSIPYYPSTGENTAVVEDCFKENTDTVVIPPSIGRIPVTELGERCFEADGNIKNIYIPDTVTRIDYSAFRGMDNLNVFVLGKNTPINNVYYDCDNMTIYMPFSSQYFKGQDAYTKTTVVNTDYEIKDMSHTNKTVTFDIHNGMFKNQPKLIVGIYDNNGKLCKVMMQQTNLNQDSYTFDTTGYGADYTAKAFMMDTVNSLDPYCEALKQRIANVEDSGETLESFHKYLNDDDETQTYTYDGNCHSLDVTFNEQTFVAENDYIYIYDANDNLVGTYTGDSLAGKTVTIPGNTVKIRLVSNLSGAAYGYKTSAIVVVKD